jgi:hypothetical protein
MSLKPLKLDSLCEGSPSITLIEGGYPETSNKLIGIRIFHIDYVGHAHGHKTLVNHNDSARPRTATRYCVVAKADLAVLVDAWPRLPEAIRAGILAMVMEMSASVESSAQG